jgi:hypothetical protein
MKQYFALLPEYLARYGERLDLFAGIVAGVLFFVIAWVSGLSGRANVVITVGIILVATLEAGYSVYREERIMRAEREAKVRLIASPGSINWNYPDPGPGKVRLKTRIHWEIWIDEDISTAQLALNIIGIRHKKWWQVFQRRRNPLIGMRPNGQDTPHYRKNFRRIDPQPIEDNAEFEYEGPLDWSDEDGLLGLELVLVTGSPAGEYRAYVDPRLWERGSTKPL